jgi:hypothetical protein
VKKLYAFLAGRRCVRYYQLANTVHNELLAKPLSGMIHPAGVETHSIVKGDRVFPVREGLALFDAPDKRRSPSNAREGTAKDRAISPACSWPHESQSLP